jgi:hypothetical protein
VSSPSYNYYVSADNGERRVTRYNGDQAADAMAAWSKAVTDGDEYVVIEALREAGPR